MSSSESDSDTAQELITNNNTLDLSDSEEFLPNPLLNNDIHSTQSATEAYKSAMDSLRSHKSQKTSSSQGNNRTQKQSEQRSALIDAEEFIDDWLIDDIQQPSKKQRLDVNGVFSSNHARQKRDDPLPRKNSYMSVKRNRNIIIDDDDDLDSNAPDNFDEIQEEIVVNDDIDFISQNSPVPSTRPLAKPKPKQLSLINFTIKVTESSAVNPSTPNLDVSSLTSTPFVESTATQREPVGPVMRVKVRVKDKLLLIPVPSG